jgi:diaminobutyrate-2-oxoglutarate transaminase
MFACEEAGIIPDAIIMSKALGGGFPLAVVAYHKKYDKWNPGAHTGTFRGNQIAMVAGAATMQYIRENEIHIDAARKGDILKNKLSALANDFPCIGEIRGRGLMVGVEIVSEQKTTQIDFKKKLDGALAKKIKSACFSHGLILETGGRHGAVLRFLPPLIITEQEIDQVIDRLGSAIQATLLNQKVA